MPATLNHPDGATDASSAPALLDFDVIKRRAGELLGIAPEEVTDGALGELFGLHRVTIFNYRHGSMKPKFQVVSDMADMLGLPVDEIRAQGNPTPPKPAAPSTPKPPAGPKPASPSKAVSND